MKKIEFTMDPELKKLIEQGVADISATVVLRPPKGGSRLSPAQTSTAANALVNQAAGATHEKPISVKVYDKLESFSVQGSSRLLEQLFTGAGSRIAAAMLDHIAPADGRGGMSLAEADDDDMPLPFTGQLRPS